MGGCEARRGLGTSRLCRARPSWAHRPVHHGGCSPRRRQRRGGVVLGRGDPGPAQAVAAGSEQPKGAGGSRVTCALPRPSRDDGPACLGPVERPGVGVRAPRPARAVLGDVHDFRRLRAPGGPVPHPTIEDVVVGRSGGCWGRVLVRLRTLASSQGETERSPGAGTAFVRAMTCADAPKCR
jgi:hypothetical protein